MYCAVFKHKMSIFKQEEEERQRLEKYEPGDWVAVTWGDMWWIGEVNTEMVHEEYAIKFMHPVDGSQLDECKIDWPEQEDLTSIPVADIFMPVSKPVPDLYKSKWCFTLPKKEIKSVIEKFDSL